MFSEMPGPAGFGTRLDPNVFRNVPGRAISEKRGIPTRSEMGPGRAFRSPLGSHVFPKSAGTCETEHVGAPCESTVCQLGTGRHGWQPRVRCRPHHCPCNSWDTGRSGLPSSPVYKHDLGHVASRIILITCVSSGLACRNGNVQTDRRCHVVLTIHRSRE